MTVWIFIMFSTCKNPWTRALFLASSSNDTWSHNKNGALKDPLQLWFSSLLPGEHQHFCLLVQGSITEDIIHLWYIFYKTFHKQHPQITRSTPFFQVYFWLYLEVSWSRNCHPARELGCDMQSSCAIISPQWWTKILMYQILCPLLKSLC